MLEVEKKNQYSFTDVQLNSDSSYVAVSDPVATYVYQLQIDDEGYLKLIRFKQVLPGARKVEFVKSKLLIFTFDNQVLEVTIGEE